MCPKTRCFQMGKGLTPLELSSTEKLLISGFLFLRPLVRRRISWKRGDCISLAKAAWLPCTKNTCHEPELTTFLQLLAIHKSTRQDIIKKTKQCHPIQQVLINMYDLTSGRRCEWAFNDLDWDQWAFPPEEQQHRKWNWYSSEHACEIEQ